MDKKYLCKTCDDCSTCHEICTRGIVFWRVKTGGVNFGAADQLMVIGIIHMFNIVPVGDLRGSELHVQYDGRTSIRHARQRSLRIHHQPE